MSSTRLAKMGVSRGLSAFVGAREKVQRQLVHLVEGFCRARDGGVAVVYAIVLVGLTGMAALALDLSQTFAVQTELKNAADAAALAGASQLDQESGSGACQRAIKAASEVVTNRETFTDNNNAGAPDVFIDNDPSITTNQSIRFLRTLERDAVTGLLLPQPQPYIVDPTLCDADANYIEVTTDHASKTELYFKGFTFAGVVGAITDIIVCDGNDCAPSGWGHDSDAYNAIRDRAAAYYPRLLTDDPGLDRLKITYDHIGLGRSGWPIGPEVWPLTTVDIGGFDFQFFTPLVGGIALQIPKCRASMTGEDFQSTPTL